MKRHNWLKKHTLGLAAALLMTAGMSQIALAGDSVYVSRLPCATGHRRRSRTIISRAICPTVRSWSAWEPAGSGR